MDSSKRPSSAPPGGFVWHLVSGIWSLIPECHDKAVKNYCLIQHSVDPGVQTLGSLPGKGKEIESSMIPLGSQGDDFDSDDSISAFEHNISDLLPSLKNEGVPTFPDNPTMECRSERQKKPSSCWNEVAGFVIEPPLLWQEEIYMWRVCGR